MTANFFTDNEDILFLFDYFDLGELARLQEDGFKGKNNNRGECAPEDEADAIDNYRRILQIVGDVSVAP